MNVLTNVPIWVYFVIMAITFMFTHVVAYKPNKVTTRSSGVTTMMRIGSSVILLVGLLVMQPAVPATLLLALALAAMGGFLSGTAAPPPKTQTAASDSPTADSLSEDRHPEDRHPEGSLTEDSHPEDSQAKDSQTADRDPSDHGKTSPAAEADNRSHSD